MYANETAIQPNTPTWTGGAPTAFSIQPALPSGLVLEATTGVISGATSRVLGPTTTHTVTASNADGQTTAQVEIRVGVLLTLSAGFAAEIVMDGLATPVKIALAPDGRLFFNELESGDTRVIRADGTLQATPFAHTDVLTAGHQGLLGLTLHPDFATNGYVYVMATTEGSGMTVDRIQVKRYRAAAGEETGQEETVIIDDLPVGSINNGGDLAFGIESPDPRLYMTIGDQNTPALSQADGSPAGRLLRFGADGSIPGDNPLPADPEWCRGLRNTFGIAVHPTTGTVFGVDNGPMSDDELNYLNKGKNFEWGGLPPMFPPQDVGIIIESWPDVIVPTALAWHDGTGWGTTYDNNLFMTSYDDEAIRRFAMGGSAFVDVDEQELFATFFSETIQNKPLDIEVASDGSLYVSTFSAIYRIYRP